MTTNKKESAPANEGFSLIPNQKLLTIYSTMLKCRLIDEQARIQLKKRGVASCSNSILGHEAAAVGAAIDLLPEDTVAPALWPDAVLKAINPSVSIALRVSLAARSAVAYKDSRKITLLFSSSKQTSQVSWHKALNLAAAQNLPILFVSLNHRQDLGRPTLAEVIPLKTRGYAIPTINVDGSDVVAVYRVASEAIVHARKGHGPTLIDCHLLSPCDPIQTMEKYLICKGLNPGKL